MRRGLRMGLLAIAALGVACRGIVGIEDLTVVDGGGGIPPGTDAGDAGKEGSVPPGPPGPPAPPPPPGDASSCFANNGALPDCMKCCRDNSGQTKNWDEAARDGGCLCGSGLCQSECSTEYCASPPGNGAPSPTCGVCLDKSASGQTANAACDQARSRCASGTTCNVVVSCFESCKAAR